MLQNHLSLFNSGICGAAVDSVTPKGSLGSKMGIPKSNLTSVRSHLDLMNFTPFAIVNDFPSDSTLTISGS
jgi:hypothetical protein